MNFQVGSITPESQIKIGVSKNFKTNLLNSTGSDVFERQFNLLTRKLAIMEIWVDFRKYMDKKYIESVTSILNDEKLLFLSAQKTDIYDFIQIAQKNTGNVCNDNKTLLRLGFCEQVEFVNDFYDSKAPKKYDDAKYLIQEYDITHEQLKDLFAQYYDPKRHNNSINLIEEKIEELQKNNKDTTISMEPEKEYDDKEILFNKIKDKFRIPDGPREQADFNFEISKYSFDEILNTIGEYIENGNYNLSEDDFKNIFEDYDLSKYIQPEPIYGKYYSKLYNGTTSYCKFANIKFAKIRKIIDNTTKQQNQSASDYYKEIIDAFRQQELILKEDKEKILSNIQYCPVYENQKQNPLSESEKLEIAKRHNYESFESYAWYFIHEYVGGGESTTVNLRKDEYEKVFTAALEDIFKPYEDEFKSEKISRWIEINDYYNDFFDTFPNEGEIYTVPCHQSYSKSSVYAESRFRKSNDDMNVEFIVYPKHKNKFKAYDIGEHKFGVNEVIYPENSQFKVLHKGWEEFETKFQGKKHMARRYMIYMQEI